MQLCDWRDLDAHIAELGADLRRAKKCTNPFPVLALVDSLSLQRAAAQLWVSEAQALTEVLPPIEKRAAGERIRVGYFSADFHNHATAYLMAELFETHDRSRFELTAFSFGPEIHDQMRSRLSAAFDRFLDVRSVSDKQVARLARELHIDIAVDLKGFTQHERHRIFSYRAAPLQVSYLGYPGTSAAPWIDYLIADPILIPAASRPGYSEKILYLPHSYQANDRHRSIAERSFTRAELGLPDSGFVFCCFNNSYKITPAAFSRWMRILGAVPGSVLWLLEDNPTAALNLRREAEARAVRAERLLFAPRLPLPEHLARHRAADLFLDTWPCNAHHRERCALGRLTPAHPRRRVLRRTRRRQPLERRWITGTDCHNASAVRIPRH